MDFSKRLLQLRENANLKQTELAQKINLKSSAISKYEKGITQPNIDTLIKLTQIFGVSIDYLIGVSDIPNPYTTDNFSTNEVNLILKFRKLSKENKIRIDERISTMKDTQN